MKTLTILLLILFTIGCSNEQVDQKAYLTDNNFEIQVLTWESWGDNTDDGVTQNVLLDSGTGGTIKFTKATGEVIVTDMENEIANSSVNGLLIFNNYWDNNPKIINFTVDGKYTIDYDSRKDSQSGSYEVSKLTAYYK